ncbi:hypothetical protein [Micromonospora sp. NPDC050200]|uniref:hypothetical protein n=1 Tax=Micromonospora sp. NPDC050200 TaxID=3155664 RepID=UPI0033EEC61F
MTLPLARKYTDADISDDALAVARHHGGPLALTAAPVVDTCQALASTEADLARLNDTIGEHLTAVRRNLTARAGDAVPSINPAGVLQADGPRLDTLIGQRAAQIHHLRTLVRIWLAHHQPPAPRPTPPARYATSPTAS